MTPLLLVTGFLGAGKTTFLRALIPALGARGLRPRIVLNDFEDARIDAATLADLTVDVVALSGSCVCCESLDDLLAVIGGLDVHAGDVVVVEANGGTEAGELLGLLGSEPVLDRLAPPLQLSVVDAQRFGTRGWQDQMEREQLMTATHFYVSRADLDAARADEVKIALARITPSAAFVNAATLADVIDEIETTVRPLLTRTALSSNAQRASSLKLMLAPTPNPAAHAHAPHFAAHLVDLPTPVDPDAFLTFLRALPAEVLRAKGIVTLTTPLGAKRSFQKVDRDAEISPCELADPDTLPPRAVFIGPSLPIAAIEASIAALTARVPDVHAPDSAAPTAPSTP